MIRKVDLAIEANRTRESVTQIMAWCIVIAAHDVQGLGGDRQERLAGAILPVQAEYIRLVNLNGPQKALQQMVASVATFCDAEIHVPMNRAPRTERERQLRMAGDQAVQIAWCTFAQGLHDTFGFGQTRLNRIKAEAEQNYRQFAAWTAGGKDQEWAMDRLRRCAQDALGEEMTVYKVEEPDPPLASMPTTDTRAVAAAVMQGMAKQVRPVGWALLSAAEQQRRAANMAALQPNPFTRFR